MYKYFFTVLVTSLFFFASWAQQLAFPTAEGYGKYTTGGRGGKVIEVTNLNSSGPGSFAAAVAESGARTIVFRVGGTINGNFTISKDDITLAGQTAPGDGIEINGHLGISASNVIVRYIRVRANADGDALTNDHNGQMKNIILDHVSASWSSDEVFSFYFCNDITIQWCMVTEAGSSDHKFGGIWGDNHGTFHHNLFAHNTDRNPRIASGSGYNDVRNNVIYNWKNESLYGGEVHQVGNPDHDGCLTNVVANYYKPGPGTPSDKATRICSPWSRDGASDYGKWYLADNYLVGHPEVTADNWLGVFPQYTGHITDDRAAIPGLKLDTPSEFMPINQQTAENAYNDVLNSVGCSFPNRDAIDKRIIEEVRNGTATFGDNGFISSPSEVGGHPVLLGGTAPIDTDHDGMPDDWETAHGLNLSDSGDRNDIGAGGYTNLEIYLNSLVKKGGSTSIKEMIRSELIPVRNYPNPFHSFTTINYELNSHSKVKLSVYNAMGKNVATLVNQWQQPGAHSVIFDAGKLESGLYFFSLKSGLSEQRGKMLLIK